MNLILDFFKNMISSVAGSVEGAILRGIRALVYGLDELIYGLIVKLYSIFESLCTVRLLSDGLLGQISRRIGLILGLFMLFRIIFSFISMLIDPDSISDSKKGAVSIIKKVILVIIMLGFSSFTFQTLFDIQERVVTGGVISKILLPFVPKYGDDSEFHNFGGLLAEETFYAFYHINVDDSQVKDSEDLERLNYCRTVLNDLRSEIANEDGPSFYLGYICLNEPVNVSTVSDGSSDTTQEVFMIDYDWLLATLAGCAIAYFLFMYCVQVGIRMIQIMVLEIISPMAIISFLSPKDDNMFSKWGKLYTSTYIDVFIRVAIINFVVMLISALFVGNSGVENGFEFWKNIGADTFIGKGFYVVIMVIALLSFAKKAPELISGLLPQSISKLSFTGSMKDAVGAGALFGGIAGSATGLLTNGPVGLVTGAFRGGAAGFKSGSFAGAVSGGAKNQWKAGIAAKKRMADIRANGGSWLGSHIASAQAALGIRNAYEEDETKIAQLQVDVDNYNNAQSEAESEALKNAQNYHIFYSVTNKSGNTKSDWSLRELEAAQKNSDDYTDEQRAKFSEMYERLKKSSTMFNLDYGAAVEHGSVTFNSDGSFQRVEDSGGNVYTTDADVKSSGVLGDTNAKIESYISSVTHEAAGVGRGNRGKQVRNNNSNAIVRIQTSQEYKQHKTDAGK